MATDTQSSIRGKATARDLASAPVVIEAREIEKSFQIASHKIDSLKERLTAFSRQEQKLLHALRGSPSTSTGASSSASSGATARARARC